MSAEGFRMYVCPQCKGQLVVEATALTCIACQRAYPIVTEIVI
ncbi:MAG: Trm112 family protein [Chloroflexota bacterium]